MEISAHTPQGVDKIKRYGWVTKDEPGDLRFIHKDALHIHPAYQRDALDSKVTAITAAWSWLSLGALVVGERDGQFWVIDGQHRTLAAKRRSDVGLLPCVVFKTMDLRTEAQGFLDLNTGRKPVTAIAKQKAKFVAGDKTAAFVQQTLDGLNLTVRSVAKRPGELKCIAWCERRAVEDADAFVKVLTLGTELCNAEGLPLMERLLEGLWAIYQKCDPGFHDKRLISRIREKGARVLLDAATRAAAYYAAGGGAVWAQGILAELNKGLRYKFTLKDAE